MKQRGGDQQPDPFHSLSDLSSTTITTCSTSDLVSPTDTHQSSLPVYQQPSYTRYQAQMNNLSIATSTTRPIPSSRSHFETAKQKLENSKLYQMHLKISKSQRRGGSGANRRDTVANRGRISDFSSMNYHDGTTFNHLPEDDTDDEDDASLSHNIGMLNYYMNDASSNAIVDEYGEQNSEEDDDQDDESIANMSLIDMYTKLPAPSIPMVPFKFLDEYHEYDLTNPKHFNSLKGHLEDYVDELHSMLDVFDNYAPLRSTQHLHTSSANDLESADESSKEEKEQPTTIQLLKALGKANKIIDEVERSHKISQIKSFHNAARHMS